MNLMNKLMAKIKIKTLFCLVFLIAGVSTYGQIVEEWHEIKSDRGDFVFKMPGKPQKFDTANILYYAYEIDSSFVIQVHLIDNLNISPKGYKGEYPTDPVELFVKEFLKITEGELLSVQNLTIKNRPDISGKEASILYLLQGDEEKRINFFKVFSWTGYFLTLTIETKEENIAALMELKTVFLNSIAFYEK